MSVTASASSAGPRYAPADPTLPKPWKGLVDGSTGYLYFWNPETNITQYERPVSRQPVDSPALLPNPPKSTSVAVSSSVQVHQSSGPSGYGHQRDSKEEDGRYNGPRSYQQQSMRSTSANHPSGLANVGHGMSNVNNQGHSTNNSKPSGRGQGSSDMGSGSSVESYRRQHEITTTGDNIPPPFMTFESTGFPPEILREVQHAGFSSPTPIQAQSWSVALQSRDIVAIAKTGSGKTLGYLIPGFIHLKRLRNNSQMGPTVLVLAPTRELATQIQDEAVKFGRTSRISCTCLYGGAPKGPQLRDLDRGADVVVATPGRLNDILEMRRVNLRQVSFLVLDEADRMLDMGFEPQIRKIVKEIPPRRQTLMFTATWPKEVRKIAADLLVHPVQVNIGSIDELVANKAITQYVELITPIEKQRRLEQILRSQEPGSKVIIFCSTKRMCDQLTRNLTRQFGAAAIHGDKSQSERDYVLSQFRSGRSPILVATDVAARGLDVKDIRIVINYDFPTGVEDYVHRIGRTGRAGATGVSYTFFSDQDAKYASDLIKVLEGAGQRVPSEIREMGSRGGYGRARNRWGSGGRDGGNSYGGGSGGRDGGSSYGGGRSDYGYGGRGGWGPSPSTGRSESGHGGRGRSDCEPPRDRYDYSYHDSHKADESGHSDGKGILGNGDHSAGAARGLDHSRSRSRSRSRSLNRYGGDAPGRGWSPLSKRDPSPTDERTIGPAHSPQSQYQQQQQRLTSPNNGEYMQKDVVELDHSPSPRPDRSQSPFIMDNGKLGSASPAQQQWRSPQCFGAAEEPTNGLAPPTSPYHSGEEEGMIPTDEDGIMIPPEEGGNSPRG